MAGGPQDLKFKRRPVSGGALVFGEPDGVDLIFCDAPATSADLVFGGVNSPPPVAGRVDASIAAAFPGLHAALRVDGGAVDATLSAALPALSAAVQIVAVTPATLAAALPGLRAAMATEYVSNTARPTISHTRARHQDTATTETGAQHRSQDTRATPAGATARWQDAAALRIATGVRHRDAVRTGDTARARHQDARPIRVSAGFRHQVAAGIVYEPVVRHQDAAPLRSSSLARHQDMTRVRGVVGGREQDGVPVRSGVSAAFQLAEALLAAIDGRYQPARPPQPATHVVIDPGGGESGHDGCYTPSGDLVFRGFAAQDGALVFSCATEGPPAPGTIIIPVRKVYIVSNSIDLIRTDTGQSLPVLSLSLSLDRDSWTWQFTARLAPSAMGLLDAGEPVPLTAGINGATVALLGETLGREREFGRTTLTLTGRGLNAQLSAPYAAVQTFGNPVGDRTAQQLMADVLTGNGVPIGWDVDFGLTDWLVPAGAYAQQGTMIDALSAIAQAAGGYLQPHDTARTFRVLPSYPALPWDWSSVTPDIELPADIVTREGTQWVSKPGYNRVFVSGTGAGVLGQVTRAGTAGDRVAPMVTDPLMTHADAARQRGGAILADTGAQQLVTLRTPVLPETGIIHPGLFVDYADAGTMQRGLVRSVSVDAEFPEVWQSIEVEIHA